MPHFYDQNGLRHEVGGSGLKPITAEELENLKRTGRLDGGTTARADSARKPQLKQIEKTDPYTKITMFEFVGDKAAWMDQFKSPVMVQVGPFNKDYHDPTVADIARRVKKARALGGN